MKRNILIATLALTGALVAAPQSQAAEIHLCEREIRAAPIDDGHGLQSGLVQGFAVVNTGTAPEKITGIALQLKAADKLSDQRWLSPADISAVARQSPQIEALAKIFPSQFCNGKLLKGAKISNSETLAPGEALIFMYQPFVWKGARDQLVIKATTARGSGPVDTVITLPIVAGGSKTQALFPVAGRSFAVVAASFHTPHRWAAIEEFALDILMLDNKGSTHRGMGTKLTDYAAFGKPVRAVAAGQIVAALDGIPDNAAMLKAPVETDEIYLARLLASQMALLKAGMDNVLGNHVVIDHGGGEYSIYAHLKQSSLRIRPGMMIKAGDIIGELGSSGNSTEPHLHFQMCDGPDIATCRPIPVNFKGYRLPLELGPRSIQSGDIVETVE